MNTRRTFIASLLALPLAIKSVVASKPRIAKATPFDASSPKSWQMLSERIVVWEINGEKITDAPQFRIVGSKR